MLEKIGKAFAVIEKLKKLPVSERKWVLNEAKLTVGNNCMLAQQKKSDGDDFERRAAEIRLETLRVIGELLEVVVIDE